ncbi:type IV pilus modification PilV family protein [Sodalinema gerasimenkoae]|uniref:type IV pilus modification PilV family protein n=1 Tax=Sodalinema gerasimenkoae TaxID=2862348 RepID=UPI001356BDB7|nr:type II secretion system protein [Sodalinema gerasimenkoae]
MKPHALIQTKRLLTHHRDRLAPVTSQDSGLTLIEGLVAILIVSAVIVGITPMMFLSVATRIQNRRAEQALQLAHGQIDQIRVLMEQGITDGNIEQIEPQLPPLAGESNINEVGPPTRVINSLMSTNSTCNDLTNLGQLTPDAVFPVDVNGDCQSDFYMQTFRTNQINARMRANANTPDIPLIFRMGVRVYYRNARVGELETDQASLVMTSGEAQQTTHPLATLYTVMSQGDTNQSLEGYRNFLQDSP